MADKPLAVETRNLSKKYGDVTAVDGLSLRVEQGEIYAFLGLNGAGKTTTIRMLLGMVKPTAGEANVLGTRIERGARRPWPFVGYLVEMPHAYPELSVRENLEAFRRLRPGTPQEAVDTIIAQLGLVPYAERRAGALSLGNKQRLGLARALMHNPQLLILDEPANGLDPAGIVEIRELLLALAHEQGVTIFLSSHILAEVTRLAQRIGIIHEGRLLQEMDVAELQRRRRRWLKIGARDIGGAQAVLADAGFASAAGENGTILLSEARALDGPDAVAALLVHGGQAPTTLVVEQEDLEHYFLRLVGAENGNGQ
jgi:ABC-2 type transport system ATP-binding protein